MTFTLFSLPWGSWKRALCPLTLVPQGLNYNPYLLNRRREREREYNPPPHTYPQLKLQTQTASNTSSDPTFQMGLSPASFKPLPGIACLHLNSLHISWILSPLHSGLLTSGTCFSGHRHLLIPNQPTALRGLTFSFALSRPVLSHVCTLSPPLVPCCSLCVSSACLLSQLSL